MAPHLNFISTESSTASDAAICKFARFLGLEVKIMALSVPLPDIDSGSQDCRIVALDYQTLSAIYHKAWFAKLLDGSRFVFVYGFSPIDHASSALEWMTGGNVTSVSRLPTDGEKRVTIHDNVTHGNFPVSGKAFTLESGSFDVFSGGTAMSGVETYVSVNGQPNFISVVRGRSNVFLLADEVLVDIDTPLAQYASIRGWYSQLIAMSIVLRVAAGPWCWTSPVTGANFIVDDPDLTQRYGFFHHETVLRELAQVGGALTVAFIPYNYLRSVPKTIDLAQKNTDRFSICVHGCDHTGGEYASEDAEWLAGLTFRARERMEAHTRQTGLPYDNVMVIPQGEFSIKGLGALKRCGIDAAINTTPWPVVAGEDRLTIKDLLQVAVTHYEGFPLFVRRYPVDFFGYAFDALFQKPILAVEHHGYFRTGCKPLTDAVEEISSIKTNLVWMPLGRAIESSCLLKQTGGNQYTVRHFVPLLRFSNPTTTTWNLSLEKPSTGESNKAVLINGNEVAFDVISGQLRYTYQLPAGQQMEVKIVRHPLPHVPWHPSIKYRLATLLRRKLSDIRDNQLARSERLLTIAEKLKAIATLRFRKL